VLDVLRWPGEEEPLESVHALTPGPLAPSEHEKLVGTTCPTAYIPPPAGEEICADGGPATV
jgi:hypothetical protein